MLSSRWYNNPSNPFQEKLVAPCQSYFGSNTKESNSDDIIS